MFQLHVSSEPQLSGLQWPWLFILANVAVASLLVCGLTLLVERFWPRRTLPLRHTILLAGLFVTLAIPFIACAIDATGFSLIEITSEQPAAAAALVSNAPPLNETTSPPQAPLQLGDLQASVEQPPEQGGSPQFSAATATNGSADHAIERALDPPAEPILTWRHLFWAGLALASIWLAGSLYELYRFVRGLFHVRRFQQTIEPVTDPRLQRLARAAAQAVGLTRCPSLGQSLVIETPVSLGALRGQVVVPARELHQWSDDAWHALLVHEMAHVRRCDPLIGFLQRVALVLYWWNPLLRRVSTRIAVLREQICDDLVTQHGSQEDRYAALIVELAGRVATQRNLGPVLGAADGTPSELATRIRRLLDPNRQLATTLSRTMKCAVTTFCIALVFGVGGTSIRWVSAQEEPSEPKSTTDSKVVEGTSALQEKEAVAKPESKAADPTDMLHKKIRVVDEQGRPIVGATVTPWAIRDALGSHGSWAPNNMGRSEPPVLTTDAEGRATIPVPRYARPEERVPPVHITCRIEHPGFVQTIYNDAIVKPAELDAEQTFVLQVGAQVEIVALDGDKPLPTERLYAQWSSDSFGLKPTVSSTGALVLPRLPAGDELVRVAYLPETGPALFSDVQSLKLTNGEHRSLRVAMRPALKISGKLDDSVPRPVKRGRIVASVINNVPSRQSIEWRTWAAIAEDGTFTLEPVPTGDLQVVGICDGFIAKDGEQPAFVSDKNQARRQFGLPQVFSVASDRQHLTLQMTPTADCTIRVLDTDGKPVPDAWVGFSPNVAWWNGGSQTYCKPLISTAQALTAQGLFDPDAAGDRFLFGAQTGADGVAVVRNLPAYNAVFVVGHDKFELPVEKQSRRRKISLKPGPDNEITVRVQPKGKEFLGDMNEDKPPAADTPSTPPVEKPAASTKRITESDATELAGVVVDEDGKPLADVDVDAWTWMRGNETTTDSEGRFRLKGFKPDAEVQVQFSKEGYSPALFLAEKPGLDDRTVVLTQGTWLEGWVFDRQGVVVPQALVRAGRGPRDSAGRELPLVWTSTSADQEGRYRLHLEPDEYVVQVRAPGGAFIRQRNASIKLHEKRTLNPRLGAGTLFRAVVRDSTNGKPVPGIVLWNSQHPDVEGVSNGDGVIEIPGMMEGEFTFQLDVVGAKRHRAFGVAGDFGRWWSGAASRSAFGDLTFNLSGAEFTADIFVEPAATIRGRVLDPEGQPVVAASVSALGLGSRSAGIPLFLSRTDELGNFALKIPASQEDAYRLVAHDGAADESRRWANAVGEPLQTSPGEQVEGVELRLTLGGTIRGRVLGKDGQPRPLMPVQAISTFEDDDGTLAATTHTDVDGRYELRMVAPGERQVLCGWVPLNPYDRQGSSEDRRWSEQRRQAVREMLKDVTRHVVVESGSTVDEIDFTVR